MRLISVWIVFTWRNEQWVLCTKFATLLLILREKTSLVLNSGISSSWWSVSCVFSPLFVARLPENPYITQSSHLQSSKQAEGVDVTSELSPTFPFNQWTLFPLGSHFLIIPQVAPSNILRHPSLPCYRVCRTLFHVFLLILFLVGPQPLYCSGPNFSLELDIPHSPFPRTPLSGLILPQSPLQTYPPSWIINSHVC